MKSLIVVLEILIKNVVMYKVQRQSKLRTSSNLESESGTCLPSASTKHNKNEDFEKFEYIVVSDEWNCERSDKRGSVRRIEK